MTSTASLRRPGPVRCVTVARTEEFIRVQATAARIACEHMTALVLEMLRAGDADTAEREMETRLRALHHMWRLAIPAAAGGSARPPGDGYPA